MRKNQSLDQLWSENEYLRQVGTPKEFLKWIGVKEEKRILAMSFLEVETLPALKKRNIEIEGAKRRMGQSRFTWRCPKSKNQLARLFDMREEKGELFFGVGETFDLAAIRGLITIWELFERRKLDRR